MPQEYTFLRRSMSYKHFELRDSSGVVQTLNAERVRALLSSGRAVIRGLKLSSDNKILIDKNEWNVAYTGDHVEKAQSEIPYPNAHIESYSGTALKEHIETNLVGVSECRDFVKSVISILTQPIQDKRVLGIVGLRGVGKTTGIWQSIQKLSRYEDTVYINVLDDDAIEYSELYTFITKNYPDKRYIFVDEITFVRDFIKASKSLYEKFVTNNKYVVISGTDSLALSQAKGNGLYHRIFIKNVTFISYNEAVRVTGVRGYKEYLELGGLFKDDFIESSAGLNEYINTAVVDNIYNTLCKNPNVTSLASLYVFGTESGKEKIRTIIYMILSAIVYSLSEKRKSLSTDFIVNLFEDTEAYGRDDMRDLLSSSLGVSLSNGYTKQDIVPILNVLVEMNVLLRIENYAERGTYNYYITNQSIFNQ